jgi:hypothetical protein
MGFSMLGAESESTLNPHLEVLRPLVGKTWKGTFNDSKPEKPTIDVARWERALNGQAVRLLHSINQGMYGGETLFVWNQKTQQVEYFYFTTAGYMTTGTMTAKDGRIDTREKVEGDAGGVTEVRGTSEILPEVNSTLKRSISRTGSGCSGTRSPIRKTLRARSCSNS